MEVFSHHLYEYRKGLRRMVLHTTSTMHRDSITAKLKKREISYIIHPVTESKINVFFGASCCIEVMKTFPHLDLTLFSPEQDFILGAMLGYDMNAHCQRYLNIVKKRMLLA